MKIFLHTLLHFEDYNKGLMTERIISEAIKLFINIIFQSQLTQNS